jgi:hypothetical protein
MTSKLNFSRKRYLFFKRRSPMEFIIIALLLGFTMFIITFGFAWFITKKERQASKLKQNQNLLVQFQKAAKGFKIATIAFLFTPLPFIFPSAIEPTDSAPAALFFMILLGVSIAVFLSSFSTIYCYNFLFYVANNRTATIILFVPLSPLILCSLAFFPILFPCAIFMLITSLILQSKRKRFFKTIEDSVFLDKPAN